jgi:hypothetical protein
MDAIIRLFEYKTKALNEMLKNVNIAKALIDNTPQFMNNSDSQILDQDFRDGLLYQQLYPYMPVTSQFTDAKSYITIALSGFKANNSSTTDGWIKIFVICHKNLVKTDNGQRHGFIANEIDNMMYNTRGFGIGKINEKRMDETIVGNDYISVFLQYHITDFAI